MCQKGVCRNPFGQLSAFRIVSQSSALTHARKTKRQYVRCPRKPSAEVKEDQTQLVPGCECYCQLHSGSLPGARSYSDTSNPGSFWRDLPTAKCRACVIKRWLCSGRPLYPPLCFCQSPGFPHPHSAHFSKHMAWYNMERHNFTMYTLYLEKSYICKK